jgi:hypothetical protein
VLSVKLTVGEMRSASKILVGKPEGKRPLGRHRHRWKGNIKTDLKLIGLEGENCILVAQDRDSGGLL